MTEERKAPKMRFPGFTDPWEQRKLEDVLQIATRRNGNSYGKEDVLSVSDEYGCVNQIKFQGRSFAGADISNYKIVKTGDIIYTRSPLQAKPFGIIKVVRDETGIVSPLYIVNEATEGNDAEFIYRVFDLPYKTNNYLGPLVRKGAKNTMNISEDEWLSGVITIAPSYKEQRIIGQYFKELDNLIALHQRKCDEVKTLKKAMLQKMFPKEGETTPEIRFPGFTDLWKQSKLNSLMSFSNGFNGSSCLYGRGTPYISVMDILNNGFITYDSIRGKVDIDEKTLLRFAVNYGDVLFQRSSENTEDAGCSNVYVSKETAAFGGFVIRGKKQSEYDAFFMKNLLDSSAIRKQITSKAQGAQHINVGQETLSAVVVTMPSIKEQKQIGNLFVSINNTILLCQQKCDELKELKKSMLQQMFA